MVSNFINELVAANYQSDQSFAVSALAYKTGFGEALPAVRFALMDANVDMKAYFRGTAPLTVTIESPILEFATRDILASLDIGYIGQNVYWNKQIYDNGTFQFQLSAIPSKTN